MEAWVSISTDFPSEWLCWHSQSESVRQIIRSISICILYPLSGVSSTLRCPQGVLTHQLQPYDMANIVTVDTITVNCNITTKHLQTGTNLPWPLTRSHTDGDIDIRHSAVLTPAPGTTETTVLCSGYLRSLCADKPIINTDTFTTPVI